MVKKNTEIDYLIIWRNLNDVASIEEQKELQNWLAQDAKYRSLYAHLKVSNDSDIEVSDVHVKLQWEQLQNRLISKPQISWKKWTRYAAAILLPITIALGVFYLSETEKQTIEMAHQIQPGSSKAILQLANGELIELDELKELQIQNDKGQVIGNDSLDVLMYNADVISQEEFNTINIPRGGEYQLILADGTKVWLNSESSLTYPVYFSDNTREVYLTGEAYFDVTTNKDVPFIVKTAKSDVKVYGTRFNVMAYEEDNVVETTLVEGSIAVLYNNQEVMVKPGQQAQIGNAGSEVVLKQVDTQLYTDWKNGIFRFEEMPLKEVAAKLSRWYDVDFYFANEEVKTHMISGAMKRNTEFSLFLSLIEKSTETNIRLDGKSVLVKGKY